MKRSLALAALLVPLLAQAADPVPVVVKLGSLAPKESPWGQVLKVWIKAVKEKSNGTLAVEIFWNGTQGDEAAQISKLKTGQLDGAIVTSVGLAQVHSDVIALQMPGLFENWEQLDKARDAMRPDFEKAFKAKGFELVGWGDVGLDHPISRGYVVKLPSDFKGKRPWAWREDPIVPAILQAIGGVQPHLTSVPEVLPELSVGNIDGMSTSAIAAEQLQWSPRLDSINTLVVAPNIGGVIAASSSLAKLSPEHRKILMETGALATKALTDRIRIEDAKALERLKKRMTVHEPTPAEREAWKKVFADARQRLARGTFSPELVKRIEGLAGVK
jgi:TRAP-type transport system periplasmic protein